MEGFASRHFELARIILGTRERLLHFSHRILGKLKQRSAVSREYRKSWIRCISLLLFLFSSLLFFITRPHKREKGSGFFSFIGNLAGTRESLECFMKIRTDIGTKSTPDANANLWIINVFNPPVFADEAGMNRRRSKSPLDSINDTRDSRLRGSSLAPTLPVIEHDKNLYGGCVDAALYFVRHCTSRNTVFYICTGGESYTFRSVYFRESAQHLARYSAAGLCHFFLFFFLPLCFLIRILGAYHVI